MIAIIFYLGVLISLLGSFLITICFSIGILLLYLFMAKHFIIFRRKSDFLGMNTFLENWGPYIYNRFEDFIVELKFKKIYTRLAFICAFGVLCWIVGIPIWAYIGSKNPKLLDSIEFLRDI